jgi:hypothetical protein
MPLLASQEVLLYDAQQRPFGRMVIERCEGELLLGQFVPGPAFAAAAPLFRRFEEAANAQALSLVDELDAAIAALGLSLHLPEEAATVPLHDVQIWSDGGISCRLGRPAPAANGSAAAARPGQAVRE